jgi:hypothetical protein
MASWINANRVGGPPPKATEQKAQRPLRVALSMYNEMPSGEIALEEFERFAIDRLKGTHTHRLPSMHSDCFYSTGRLHAPKTVTLPLTRILGYHITLHLQCCEASRTSR